MMGKALSYVYDIIYMFSPKYADKFDDWYYKKILKKEEKELEKIFPPGIIVQDCSYHPCMVVRIRGDTLELMSLVVPEKETHFCSGYLCGVYPMHHQEVKDHILIYQKEGNKGLAILNGWTEEDFDDFEREWGKI